MAHAVLLERHVTICEHHAAYSGSLNHTTRRRRASCRKWPGLPGHMLLFQYLEGTFELLPRRIQLTQAL